jgi:hypothetical protein
MAAVMAREGVTVPEPMGTEPAVMAVVRASTGATVPEPMGRLPAVIVTS